MTEIKLFKINGPQNVVALPSHSVAIEKSLQVLIENNLKEFLGVTFLATEYKTGGTKPGRIDTLGIDENDQPVIVEYKRDLNENVVNQGLFYLDWLMDHKEAFEMLVLKKIGAEQAEEVEWSQPRLICIAGDYNKYDEHAVAQINRNIDLFRYRRYGTDLLLLERVNAKIIEGTPSKTMSGGKGPYKQIGEYIAEMEQDLSDVFEALKAFLTSLGDDVQMATMKYYLAFKRIKNFACISVQPTAGLLVVWVKVDPSTVKLEDGFTKDVTKTGHHGTGDLEIRIKDTDDLEKAKPLLIKSYEAS